MDLLRSLSASDVTGLFAGDIIFYLRGIPLIAALALQPHRKYGEGHLGLGYLDFGLLLTWWTFLYVYVVLPWMYATPTLEIYNTNYNTLTYLQHFLITVGFAICWLRTRGAWRLVYFNLFAATALYMLGIRWPQTWPLPATAITPVVGTTCR